MEDSEQMEGATMPEPQRERNRLVIPQEMKLLDLPDAVFVAVFDALAEAGPHLSTLKDQRLAVVDCSESSPQYSAFSYAFRNDSKRALSLSCPRLNEIFRKQYVERLHVRPSNDSVLQSILRTVSRFPAAREILVLEACDFEPRTSSRLSWPETRVKRAISGELYEATSGEEETRVEESDVRMVTFNAPWQISTEDVGRFFCEMAPVLHELHFAPWGTCEYHRLSYARDLQSIGLTRSWLGSVPTSLRKLTLVGTFGPLSDVEDQRIGALTSLRELTLLDCCFFRQGTWNAFGKLRIQSLHYELTARFGTMDMAVLEDGIAGMSLLQRFVLLVDNHGGANIHTFRVSLLERLPSTLSSVTLSVPFDAPLPAGAFGHLTALIVLNVKCEISSWGTFSSMSPNLRILKVRGRIMMENAEAENVFTTAAFRNLTQLDLLSGAAGSCRIASLVADLRRLKLLTVGDAEWQDEAISYALFGPAELANDRILKYVHIMRCKNAGLMTVGALSMLPYLEDIRICGTTVGLDAVRMLADDGACPKLRSLYFWPAWCSDQRICRDMDALFNRFKARRNFHLTAKHRCPMLWSSLHSP